MLVVLVRHAHAGDKHAWSDRDELRPLSDKGLLQAASGVAPFLVGTGVTRLLSSPAVRCVQTLRPAAEPLGLRVETADELAVSGSVDRLLRLLEHPASDGAALCTHGETLTALSAAWIERGGLIVDPEGKRVGLAGTPKGAAWVVEVHRGRAVLAQFVPTHMPAFEALGGR